jgi:hypothetical protein
MRTPSHAPGKIGWTCLPYKAKEKLPTGKVKIEVETTYAVLKPAGPLNVTTKVNGKIVAEGKVPISEPLRFSANDCLDIGADRGSGFRWITSMRHHSS